MKKKSETWQVKKRFGDKNRVLYNMCFIKFPLIFIISFIFSSFVNLFRFQYDLTIMGVYILYYGDDDDLINGYLEGFVLV